MNAPNIISINQPENVAKKRKRKLTGDARWKIIENIDSQLEGLTASDQKAVVTSMMMFLSDNQKTDEGRQSIITELYQDLMGHYGFETENDFNQDELADDNTGAYQLGSRSIGEMATFEDQMKFLLGALDWILQDCDQHSAQVLSYFVNGNISEFNKELNMLKTK